MKNFKEKTSFHLKILLTITISFSSINGFCQDKDLDHNKSYWLWNSKDLADSLFVETVTDYISDGNIESAKNMINTKTKNIPQNFIYFDIASYLYEIDNRTDSAIYFIKKAIRLNNQKLSVHKRYINILMNQKNYKDALDAIVTGKEYFPAIYGNASYDSAFNMTFNIHLDTLYVKLEELYESDSTNLENLWYYAYAMNHKLNKNDSGNLLLKYRHACEGRTDYNYKASELLGDIYLLKHLHTDASYLYAEALLIKNEETVELNQILTHYRLLVFDSISPELKFNNF